MNTTVNTKDEATFNVVYKMIKSKANSNAFIQGVSGVAGFPATLAVDGMVLLTHYEPMVNDIRGLYGRNKITAKDLQPIVGGLIKELLIDIAADKIIGHVPVIGIYFNAISAKALTWRLGMLATIISARGQDFTKENVYDTIRLIRCITPQTDMFKFTKPNYNMFKKIVFSVSDEDIVTFDDKVKRALEAFE